MDRMKQRIIEILREHQTLEMLVPDSKWVIMRDKHGIIADEIHALYQDELDACEHYRQLQAESLETLRQSVGEPDHLCPKCGVFDCLQHGYAIGEEW